MDSFPPFLVVITALAGTLLSAAGGRVAHMQRRRGVPVARHVPPDTSAGV